MELTCSFGTKVCNNENEIEETIKKCASKPFDEIWLKFDQDFPRLIILINGQFACAQFSESTEKHYYSVGDEKSEEVTQFYADKVLSEIPNSMVISLTLAIDCAKNFFISKERPSCIKWSE